MPANYVSHIESSSGRSVALDKPCTALPGEMLEVRYDLARRHADDADETSDEE